MPPRPVKEKIPSCGFYVAVNRTDESVPIKIKKVAKGKRVSVLSGIVGNRQAAVNTLRQLLGVGGELCEDVWDGIELQGDQTARIATTLRSLGALRGESVKADEVLTVKSSSSSHKWSDKLMKKDGGSSSQPPAQFPPAEMSKSCILVHGKFWPYCNGVCTFCPPLTDVFEGLDMYCSWFEPSWGGNERMVPESTSAGPMSTNELTKALGRLGMKAQVGEAVQQYEKDKQKSIARSTFVPHSSKPHVSAPVVQPVPAPPVVRVAKKKFENKPVRVIMNKPEAFTQRAESEWFTLTVSAKDSSLWISDLQSFLVSVIQDTRIELVHHELADSKRLEMFFFDKRSMRNCQEVLEEVMSGVLEFDQWEPLGPADDDGSYGEGDGASEDGCLDEVEESVVPGESIEVDIEGMANELGLGENELFWEMFTHLIDSSDGTPEGIKRAFSEAVIRVT